MSDISEFQLPSDPEDLKFIKGAITEISAQQQMIKDRQESIRDVKSELKERFEMPPRIGEIVSEEGEYHG